MSDQHNGGPAFPNEGEPGSWGMTLRDWFAGQSLAGLRANPEAWKEMTWEDMRRTSWEDADAMLAERDRDGEA